MKKLLLCFSITCFISASSWATSHSVITVGFNFNPATLVIQLGDTVNFTIGSGHDAAQISAADWNANNPTPVIGFNFPEGSSQLIPTTTDTIYYICQPHAGMGMKGRIIVQSPNTSVENAQLSLSTIYANTSTRELLISGINNGNGSLTYNIMDMSGKTVLSGNASNTHGTFVFSIGLTGINSGIYIVELRNAKTRLTKKFYLN